MDHVHWHYETSISGLCHRENKKQRKWPERDTGREASGHLVEERPRGGVTLSKDRMKQERKPCRAVA